MNHRDTTRIHARLRRLPTRTPPAILLGTGSTNDLSFLRSLGRRGVPAVHLVADRLLGSYSGYGVRVRMPAVEEEPATWLAMLDLVAAALHTPAVLFALSDQHCAFVAHHAERLRRGGFRFVVPDVATVETILDKRRQYGAAEDAGITVPLTFYPESVDELRSLAATLRYPVILKPYTAHVGRPRIGNRKVVVVDGADDLIAAFATCTASGARFMVQTIVAGEDDAIFWYSGFWDEQGRERAWFTVQKLRQFPRGFGDGCLQRTVEMPAVLEQSRRLLAAFRYRGLVMVEFKRNPIDGECALIEINPRTVSGNQLGITAGVDLPWITYRHLIDDDGAPAAPPAFRPDVQYVNEEWDPLAFWESRRAGTLTLGAWLRSLRGTRALAVFAWDDPRPLLVGLWRFVLRCLRGPGERLRPLSRRRS